MPIVIDWILFLIVSIAIYVYQMDQPPPPSTQQTTMMQGEADDDDKDYADLASPASPSPSTSLHFPLSCMDDRLSPLLSLHASLIPPSGSILPEPSQFNKALILLQSLSSSSSSSTLPATLTDYMSLNLRKAIKYDTRRSTKSHGSAAAVVQYYEAVMCVLTSTLDGTYDAFTQTMQDGDATFAECMATLIDTIQEEEEFCAWEYKLRAIKIVRHDVRWQRMLMRNKPLKNALKACEAILTHVSKIQPVNEGEQELLIQQVVDKLIQQQQQQQQQADSSNNKGPVPLSSVTTTELTRTRIRSLSQSVKWPLEHAIIKTA